MKKALSENVPVQLAFLSVVVMASRFPFLWAGFGSEEDAWLLPLTAKNIALSGTYEMSREPGHPLQEMLYACMYSNGLFAFATNLLSAAGSVIASVFFALTLRNLGFRNYLFAAFAFAFTPVVFIASTYTIDYMPAMASMMISFYFITSRSKNTSVIGWGGLFLGIAVGFRITSGILLIPFCFLLLPLSSGWKKIAILCTTTVITGLLTYLPVLNTYGFSFFTYNDQFPYPNLPKVVFKATIGVFGTIGIGLLILSKLKVLADISKNKQKWVPEALPFNLFCASLAVIFLYLFSYLRLPQKSAYLIPVVPFVIVLYGYYLSERAFRIFCVLITLSSFLFSMNLTDPLRGSAYSPASFTFTVAGQEVFIDPFSGPVYADLAKRKNKIAFTEKVFEKTRTEKKKIVLISGWWYNQVQVRYWGNEENPNVIFVFYIGREEMERYLAQGYELYYLPEQDLYNDQYSKMVFTRSAAKPYM